jgi:hypothetical protein
MERPEIYTPEDLLAFCATLPCYGVVSKVAEKRGDYYYLLLPEEWQREAAFLAEAARSLYQYDKKVGTSVHELRKTLKKELKAPESWFPCPTLVGLHVSIGKHELGERIAFTVDKLMTYENQTMSKASHFDPTKHVARWVAVRINLATPVAQVSSTHVSIAAVGFDSKK